MPSTDTGIRDGARRKLITVQGFSAVPCPHRHARMAEVLACITVHPEYVRFAARE